MIKTEVDDLHISKSSHEDLHRKLICKAKLIYLFDKVKTQNMQIN